MPRLLKITTLVVCGLIVAAVALVLSLRLIVFRHPCDRVKAVLSQDAQGRSVVSVFQACTTIGTSSEGWVDLVLPEGRRVRLFTFVPWDGELRYRGVPVEGPFKPSATWLTPSDLRLSVGTVNQIILERHEAAGVHISYDVRTDLSK
jgi:hypothetical protein